MSSTQLSKLQLTYSAPRSTSLPEFDELSSDDSDTLQTPDTDVDHSSINFPPLCYDPRYLSSPKAPTMMLDECATHYSLQSNRSIIQTKAPLYTSVADEVDPFAVAFLKNMEHEKNRGSPSPRVSTVQMGFQHRSNSCPRLRKPKPRIQRSGLSEWAPSTLARTYSQRFPEAHRLSSHFVRLYELGDELGSGGYGFVMTARHRFEGYEVAVKFITKEKIPEHALTTDDQGRECPVEAKVLSAVRHPGIIKFYHLFEDELYFYLIQELHGDPWVKKVHKKPVAPVKISSRANPTEVDIADMSIPKLEDCLTPTKKSGFLSPEGQGVKPRPQFTRRASHDVFEYIEQSKNKRLSESDAKYIFAQVVDIVDYLDSIGITHRDVKDENLVIDRDLRIKLIDFGSVVVADPSKPRPFYENFFGTTAYAASEILREEPYQAAPAEIWTLGVLLSYLVTGSSPFPTVKYAIHGRIALDIAADLELSEECLGLLRRCLERDPERRATIAEVKAHPWLDGAFADCQ